MIHYQLRCEAGHEFDGWFKNSEGFEVQVASGLVACPSCGSMDVSRALMAPAIPRKGRELVVATEPSQAAPAVPQAAGGAIPDSVRAALQKLREEVEKNCDYVGPDFAEEARRIHHGEAPPRGIYGESSDEDAEALADDGIAFARIPWVPRNDS
ncbi:DUF1178 family protein [Acidocella aminolytica]|jgi:hypothetical protein|uniref:DUF1178 family protein n=1 Tax=Acidocella aminolytica 101 = DSM 11237 TaxID=1120923 RepID=A0A0D6PD16_9PROT|nr:DUF1178 family protein [Acidocella aminolytica]GAN78754.1 hypothetical protein Aam_007_041 [Acidocella aminolytica 101 = DSM 11237]GBQ38798.1 hypothetical protein AA11237_1895 [Acidocella aminolytica 101 = DSM 11237]SHE79300.1 hypothetical protein SAMN02746095_01216 [Acidocella aminolytica 101 = DSM 11237]